MKGSLSNFPPIPVVKLLGFKDRSDLAFEDNIKHSLFLHPDEMVHLVVLLRRELTASAGVLGE